MKMFLPYFIVSFLSLLFFWFYVLFFLVRFISFHFICLMCRQRNTVEKYFDSIFVSAPFFAAAAGVFVCFFLNVFNGKTLQTYNNIDIFLSFITSIPLDMIYIPRPINMVAQLVQLKQQSFFFFRLKKEKKMIRAMENVRLKNKKTHKVIDDGLLLLGCRLKSGHANRIFNMRFIDEMRSHRLN